MRATPFVVGKPHVLRVFAALICAASACASAAAPPTQDSARFSADFAYRPCDGLICMDVSIDGGAPRTLMLDTGNAHSTLLTDVAQPLGWELKPVQRDGKDVAGIYRAGEHRVRLGAIEGREDFFVFDRALLGEHRPPVDGSIAYDFFKDRVLEIDFERHRLRISDVVTTPVPDRAADTGTLKLITFGEHGPPIVVGAPFTLDGKPLHAQIDTVFTGTLLVYDRAVEALDQHKQGKSEFFGYTDGGVNLLATTARSIGFGDATIAKKPTVYFVGEGDNPVHQPDGLFEATVGNALFAHSILTMDFHAGTVAVRPAR